MNIPRPPDACNTMSELRVEIDRIDNALLYLLAERMTYIERAIILKPRENLPARTTDRVAQVVENVRILAVEHGLDADLIERMWRNMIEWAIAHEAKTLGG